MKEQIKELGKVVDIEFNNQAWGTIYVHVETATGRVLFGGLVLDEEARVQFESDLLWLFGAGAAVMTFGPNQPTKAYGAIDQLIDEKCYVLRSWEREYVNIVGIQSTSTGRIMTLAGFRKRYGLASHGSVLEERITKMAQDIKRREIEIQKDKMVLSYIEKEYVHWDELGMERE